MSAISMLCASYGSVSLCGRRREMEDVITEQPDFVVMPSSSVGVERFDCYGVYDGHGGSRIANLCSELLHNFLAVELEQMLSSVGGSKEMTNKNWEEVMKTAFIKMDEEIVKIGVDEEVGGHTINTIGSTAVVTVLTKDKIVVANCGDSRVVLYRGGVAIPLSTDHKPDRPDELERVEAAGRRVIDWNGHRVFGVLATSRSIGDYYFKPNIIGEPEVVVMERELNDEFLILASDGLWDVMSNEVACDMTKKCFDGRIMRTTERSSPVDVASVLAELAIARGSKDNISIIIAEFDG